MIKSNVFEINRPWGKFRQFTHDELSTVKIIKVLPNEILSLQSHKERAEFWHVISGTGTVQIGEVIYEAKADDEFEFGFGEKHRLSGGKEGLVVLEIATGHFDENDIIHYEDKYGRV